MALRLRVVSEHSTRLGEKATKVFGVHGGSIGRGTDNEWILPDPERYLSGKHARIDFRPGTSAPPRRRQKTPRQRPGRRSGLERTLGAERSAAGRNRVQPSRRLRPVLAQHL